MLIRFELNGKTRAVDTDPAMRLIDLLRGELHLTAAKEGCGEGECGACTVVINGRAALSCLTLAGQVNGARVQTAEGLADADGSPSELQRAFIKSGAIQCGYCTPGMLMSAKALLARNTDPSEEDIRKALAGNLCRCGDYSAIIDAVLEAAAAMCTAQPARESCGAIQAAPPVAPARSRSWRAPRTEKSLARALAAGSSKIIAGGTDLVIEMRANGMAPGTIIDVSGADFMKRIAEKDNLVSIGAAAAFTDIAEDDVIKRYFPALQSAAASVGSKQIRNRATIGGNVANGSPAADSLPPLAALGAQAVLLCSDGSKRRVPVCRIASPSHEGLRADEAVISFELPKPRAESVNVSCKLGSRREVSIARLSAALCADIRDNTITSPTVVLGALSQGPLFAERAAKALEGAEISHETALRFAEAMSAEVDAAIPDRPSRAYKRTAIRGLALDLFGKLAHAGGSRGRPL